MSPRRDLQLQMIFNVQMYLQLPKQMLQLPHPTNTYYANKEALCFMYIGVDLLRMMQIE